VAQLKQEWAGQGPFAEFLLKRKQLDRTAAKTLLAIRKGYLVGDAADIRRALGLSERPEAAVAPPTVPTLPSAEPQRELPPHDNVEPIGGTVSSAAEPVAATPSSEQSPSESVAPPAQTMSGEAPAVVIEPAEPLKAGTVLDRYSLEEVLGEGASATIYRSYHKLLKIPVAIKVYKRDALNLRKGGTERILLEGQMMIRLDHPNIVRVLDISLHDGVPYLVFEYVSEMSLQDLIENIGRLPAERVAQVGAQVAAALAVTSSEGLLHRDVKPEQISSVGSVRNRSLHR